MMDNIDFLNRYIASTGHELRVVTERFHGSCLRAFVLPDYCADFFVNNLLSDYCDADATISFLDEHPLFPAAKGNSLEQVLFRLDRKLAVLYHFEIGRHGDPIATPNFIINNSINCGPDTKFEDVVNDLSRFYQDDGWYDWLKNNLSSIESSHVYRFLKYNDPNGLRERLEEAGNLTEAKSIIN